MQKVPLFIWISLGRLPACAHLADLDFTSQIKEKNKDKNWTKAE